MGEQRSRRLRAELRPPHPHRGGFMASNGVKRRDFLRISAIGAATTVLGITPADRPAHAAALTKAQRDKLTPDEIIAHMKKGNERFRLGQESPHDYLPSRRQAPEGQYPAAIHPELHRFPRARRDDHGPGHRRLLQRAGGRQHRQRRHRREHGVRVQGGRREGRAGDGAHGVRRDQGRNRQRPARKLTGLSQRSVPPSRPPPIRAIARPRTMALSTRSPARTSSSRSPTSGGAASS